MYNIKPYRQENKQQIKKMAANRNFNQLQLQRRLAAIPVVIKACCPQVH